MRLRTTTATFACLAAIAGCGGGSDEAKQIPAEARAELDKQLESIENRFDAGGGACSDIAENQQIVARELDGLGDEVDPEVRDALSSGFDRLFELTASQCDEQRGQETETTPTETAPPETTETTPPETTETTPPEETAPQEDDGDGNSGNGRGNGNGGGSDGGGGAVVPDGDGDGGAGIP